MIHALKLFLIFFMLPNYLYCMSIDEYINIALTQSNQAQNIQDNLQLSKMDVDLQENTFEVKLSPDSYGSLQDDSTNAALGVKGSIKNSLGGEGYGNVNLNYNHIEGIENEYGSSGSLGYRQSLWQKFGSEYTTEALYIAKQRYSIQHNQSILEQEDIIITAAINYYRVLLEEKKQNIQKKSLDRNKHNYLSAQAKANSGMISKVDVYRAKINYLNQVKLLSDTDNSLLTAYENALFFINLDAESFSDSFTSLIKPLDISTIGLDREKVLNENPKWQQMLHNENILRRSIFTSKRNLAPDFILDGNVRKYTYQKPSNEMLDWNKEEWSVTLNVNYEFDRLPQEQELQKNRLQLQKLLRDKNTLKRSILKDLRIVSHQYERFKVTIEIENQKVQQSQEALEVAKLRFERGISGNLDLIDAENAYLQAQISYLNNIVEYNIATLQLLRSYRILTMELLDKILK